MAYTLSWSKEVVIVTLTGVIDADALMTMADDIASDYRFDDLRKRIYDCTEVIDFDLSFHDIKIFIHVDSAAYATNPNAHIAIVTPDESVEKSVAFYRQRFSHTPWHVHIVKTLAEAEAWQVANEQQQGQVAQSQPRPAS